MHPSGSPQPRNVSTERLARKLQERQQKNQPHKTSPDSSSLTSSPSSSSSFVPSQSASPDSHHSPYSNGHSSGNFINFNHEHIVPHHIAQFVGAVPNRPLFPIQLIAERKKTSDDDKRTSNERKVSTDSGGIQGAFVVVFGQYFVRSL